MFIITIITLIKTFLKRADHRTLSRLLQMFRYLLCARPSATAMALLGIYTDHDNSYCSHKQIVFLMVMIMPLITARLQRTDYLTSSRKLQMLQILFIIYMSDIHTVSNNLNFILYADDTTLTSPLCSFTYGGYQYIKCVSTLIN